MQPKKLSRNLISSTHLGALDLEGLAGLVILAGLGVLCVENRGMRGGRRIKKVVSEKERVFFLVSSLTRSLSLSPNSLSLSNSPPWGPWP